MKRTVFISLLLLILVGCAVAEPPATYREQTTARATLFETGECPGCDLRGLDLRSYGSFMGANFSGANLSGTDLQGMNLERANFSGADLRRANLTNASLIQADLRGADLREAKLEGAILQGALTDRAKLQGTVGQLNTDSPNPSDEAVNTIQTVGGIFLVFMVLALLPMGIALARILFATLADISVRWGLRCAQQQDYRGAIARYNYALVFNRSLIQAYLNRGSAYLQLGEFNRAITDANRVMRLESTRLQLGKLLGTLPHPSLRLESSLPGAYFLRGKALANRSDLQAALADFNQALSLNPDLGAALAGRGAVRSQLGDYLGALEDCNQAIGRDPEAATYCCRAWIHCVLGNYAPASDDATQALRLRPSLEALVCRGVARYELTDEQGAIADWQRAAIAELNSTQSLALKFNYYWRGVARCRLGQNRTAVEDFYAVLRLDANFAAAYAGRGLARFHLGNTTAAIEDLTQALNLAANPDYYYGRGTIYVFLGNHPAAIADFDQALQGRPEFTMAYYSRGNARYDAGDESGARTDYRLAMEMLEANGLSASGLPYGMYGYYARGLARLRSDMRTSGISDLQTAAKLCLEMNHSLFHQRIVELLENMRLA